MRYIRNLHPNVVFTNAVTRKGGDRADFWTSWVAKAERGDKHAQAMTRKYQHRPAEELYDVAADPHCLKNLIDDPRFAAAKKELSAKLAEWMEAQGDTGAPIEENALERLARKQKKNGQKKNVQRKKKTQKQPTKRP